MAHDVFISYSHKDAVIADAICHKFEQQGIRCWYAPRNIQPGQEWASAIVQALESARVMVLIFTDFSNASAQVHREVDAAVSAGVSIIPFKCTHTNPSGGMKYYLSTLHWLDAVDKPLDKSLGALLALAEGILSSEPTETSDGEPPEAAAERTAAQTGAGSKPKTGTWIALAVAVIAIAVAAILIPKLSAPKTGDTPANEPQPESTSAPTSTPAPTSKPTASGSGTSSFSNDENDDSPHADEYLYNIGSYNSDIYPEGVCLDAYFGAQTGALEIPAVIDGRPVTEINEKCFEGLEGITSVVLPETLEAIRYRAFYGCEGITEITYPASLTSIGPWSFAHTGLVNVVIPDTVTYLGNGAFSTCSSLETVIVSSNVTDIEYDTFRTNVKLKTITFRGNVTDIHIDALRNTEQATIIAPAGTYPETYAKGKKMNFEALKG